MITRYYPAETIIKEALCDNCGAILRYARSDFGRGACLERNCRAKAEEYK